MNAPRMVTEAQQGVGKLFSWTLDKGYTGVDTLINKATQYLDEIEQFMANDKDAGRPAAAGKKPDASGAGASPGGEEMSTRHSTGSRAEKKPEARGDGEKAEAAKATAKKGRETEDSGSLMGRLSDLTNSAYRLARRTTGTSLKVGKAIIKSQDQLKVMLAAGQSLKDLREVAGLTVNEMADALNLKDKTLLEAVENGTATLSFELILRLAALLARNDPVPFILKYTRTYSPDTWRILHDWGIGRIPLHFERERNFINIYRSHDAARKLSDEGFEKVLEFTRKAFELSLHFIAQQEHIDKMEASEEQDEAQRLAEELKQRHAKDFQGS